MAKKKVFILQDTNEQIENIKENFISDERFEIVGESTDGDSALGLVCKSLPDVIVLELVLSGNDGLSLVAKLKSQLPSVKIVVLSALKRDEIVKMATNAGADYFMAKPCNYDHLKERILELFEEIAKKLFPYNNNKEINEKLGTLFINVGIPPHIKGYSFLREGIKIAIAKPEVINNITKQLYPMIGEIFSTSASKVERAIRHAIEVAWNRGRIDGINNLLGVKAFVGKEKPTNGEFIALIADKMMIEQA